MSAAGMVGPADVAPLIQAARRVHLGLAQADEQQRLRAAGWRALGGGANSGVYAVQHGGETVCIKCYRVDGRDRAGREWRALHLLAAHAGPYQARPLAYAPDAQAPIVVMELLAGQHCGGLALTTAQIDALVDLRQRYYAIDPAAIRPALPPVAGDAISLIGRVRLGAASLAAARGDELAQAGTALLTAWLSGPEPGLLAAPQAPVFSAGDGNQANYLWNGAQLPALGNGGQLPALGNGAQLPALGNGAQLPALGNGAQLRRVDFEYSGWCARAYDLAELVEHAQSRATDDAVWAGFIDRFGLSAAERRQFAAARRMTACFWVALFWARGGQIVGSPRRSLLAAALERLRRLSAARAEE